MRSKQAELKKNCETTKAQGGDKFCILKVHALKIVPKLIPAMPVCAGSTPERCLPAAGGVSWLGVPREQHPHTSGALLQLPALALSQ